MTPSLKGLSSMATRLLLAELAGAWQRQGGGEVRFESVGGVDAARRILDGEPCDIVVLADDAMRRLAAAGRVRAGSVVALARSPVAVAVRAGASRPDIGTEDALRRAVLEARTVGVSTGPSGTALGALFERWGLAARLRERLVHAPAGVPVGALVARGEVELGFQQLSELMHLPGITVLGPMPPGTEIVTTFSGGCGTTSARPGDVAAVLDFMRSGAADDARRRQGMQPA